MSASTWEILASLPTAAIRRRGRFVVADLSGAHLTITTSARNGGQTDHVRHLVNHQSCEGAGHEARFRIITNLGHEAYHDHVCDELGLPSSATAVMGTAANMNYAAITTERDAEVEVTAIVTMTEGKSAALQRLAVPSCYSPDLATGTGTDQFLSLIHISEPTRPY